jgi:hypothetical protein
LFGGKSKFKYELLRDLKLKSKNVVKGEAADRAES